MRRLSVISGKPFEDVVAAFEAAVGRPDMSRFRSEFDATKTHAEMEAVVQRSVGTSGFMEFARFDLGAVLRKEEGSRQTRKIVRFLIGNPLVMKEMVKHVPDAGSYAPVTILIDERPDGVHFSYDTMAGFLAVYGNAAALKVAQELDGKVERLLRDSAGS